MTGKHIKTSRLNHHTLYISRDAESGANPKLTYFRLESFTDSNGFVRYMLYDTSGNPVKEFYEYLNLTLHRSSLMTRKKIAYALKTLYECLDIYDEYGLDNINARFISIFRAFSVGSIVNDKLGSNVHNADRKIRICIDYISALGHSLKIDNEIPITTDIAIQSIGVATQNSYLFRPTYISDEEFVRLIEVMTKSPRRLYNKRFITSYEENTRHNKNADIAAILGLRETFSKKGPPRVDLESILIIVLMFTCGLRIGEVLGLTTEDIKNEQGKCYIILRNRLSDKPGQYAKNLTHPFNESDYKKAWYRNGSGSSVIEIPQSIYSCIMSYIDLVLNRYIDIIDSPTLIADSVEQVENVNHYLFMNYNGNRLSYMQWNAILRDYFDKAKIMLDKKTKSTNLNHRFRHSYAIRLVSLLRKGNKANPDNPPFGVADLARALRHKNMEACLRYFTWTEEESIMILNDFSREFTDEYPEVLNVFGIESENKGETT